MSKKIQLRQRDIERLTEAIVRNIRAVEYRPADTGVSGVNDGSGVSYIDNTAGHYSVPNKKKEMSNEESDTIFDFDFTAFMESLRIAVNSLRDGGKAVAIRIPVPVDDIKCYIDGVVRVGVPAEKEAQEVMSNEESSPREFVDEFVDAEGKHWLVDDTGKRWTFNETYQADNTENK